MRKEFRIISFDLWGTLIKPSGMKYFGEKLGVWEQTQYCFELYKKGKASYEEVLKSWYEPLTGRSLEEIYVYLDEAEKAKDIEETISLLKKMGLRPIILSDAPTYLSSYMKKHGFEDFLGSKGEVDEKGKIKSFYPIVDKYKELESRYWEIPKEKCIHVGDGKNDVEVFKRVGLGVAFNPESEEVEKAADIVIKSDSLLDVYKEINLNTHWKNDGESF